MQQGVPDVGRENMPYRAGSDGGGRVAVIQQLLKFGGVGIINTVLTFAVIVALKSLFGANDLVVNVIAYLFGLGTSFSLNRQWSFSDSAGGKSRLVSQIGRFLTVFLAAYTVNVITVFSLIASGVNSYLAHAAGMPFYTLLFFFGCRLYVFNANATIWKCDGSFVWPLLIALTSAATVLFYDLGVRPIELWDESRLVNNAIEMAVSGNSVVSTFDGVPDHWNTKPPALIVLMAMSLRLNGFDEFGARVPAALAALGTLALVWAFVGIRLQRPITACLAVLVLLAEPHYVHEHGARTANYESLLGFFTTAYLLAMYIYMHAETNRSRWLSVSSLLVFLAFMTKTIQGLLFLPAIFMLLMARRDGRRCLEFVASMALLMLAIVAYYLLRENADPGYINAVIENDLLGRYKSTLEGHHGDALFYLRGPGASLLLVLGLVSVGGLSVFGKGEVRTFSQYALIVMLGYLAVISSAGTKLPWYKFPLLPTAAAGVGLLVAEVMAGLASRLRKQGLWCGIPVLTALFFVAVVVVGGNVERIDAQNEWASPKDACNKFLLSDAARDASKAGLAVIHPGYGAEHYHAPTSFYTKILDHEGGRTIILPPGAMFPEAFAFALSCAGSAKRSLEQGGRNFELVAREGSSELLKFTEARIAAPIRRD